MNRLSTLSQHPVFWVVLSLSLVISPHLERFPAWSILVLFGLFAWRLFIIKQPKWLPPKWLLIIIATLSSVGIFMHFGTLFGKTAGSVLLSILLAIKLHESESRRDYMILISLSFFIIVTNFLFSQSIPTLVFMLLVVIVLVMSMISINQGEAKLDARYKLRLAARLIAQATPLMLIMFILFPRIPGPLWKLPDEQESAQTGLSNNMTPGNISSLIQSNKVAFRVAFEDTPPPQEDLYWRAMVLWYFDGRTWEEGKINLTPSPSLEASTNTLAYTVTIEPHQQTWLPGLDMPVEVQKNINYNNNFLLRSQHKLTSLFQYDLKSSLRYRIQHKLSPWEKSAGLKIPPNTNVKTLLLGQQLASQYSEPEQIIDHVLAMYNQQKFHYTLQPPLTPGFDPVDQFLFDTKKGFCEHYAGSFALLMRAAGIPARIVLGYQGGTLNPLNQVMTVRQKDAHAWSEVWLENKGWIRVDPTAAIAPERVEQSLNAALDPDEARPFHMQVNIGLIRQAGFYWDAIDNQWKQWVIGYNTQLQQQLLQALFKQHIPFSDMILMMIIGFMCLLVIISIGILKPWKRQPRPEPVVQYYERFCKKLAKRGIIRAAHEGPVDFAERACERLPGQKDSIQLITRLYTRLRYEKTSQTKQLDQLRQRVLEFRVEK